MTWKRSRNTCVVIGNGAAGLAAVRQVRECGDGSRIVLVSEEPHPTYLRVLISDYLGGVVGRDRLSFVTSQGYRDLDAEFLPGATVLRIDPGAKHVEIRKGRTTSEIGYDRLLLATGAEPVPHERFGQAARSEAGPTAGVFYLRTLDDATRILEWTRRSRTGRAVILGGGLVGLKAACALRQRGIEVVVVARSSQILSRNLDTDAAAVVQGFLEEKGITFKLDTEAVSLIPEPRGGQGLDDVPVKGLVLEGGGTQWCDAVIVAKGVRPRTELARAAGIACDRGIVVNEAMETTAEGVYAAGDACVVVRPGAGGRGRAGTADAGPGPDPDPEGPGGTWASAVTQGAVAGANMAGERKRLPRAIRFNCVNLMGLHVVSAGSQRRAARTSGSASASAPASASESGSAQRYSRRHGEFGYASLTVRDNAVAGFSLVGDIRSSGLLMSLAQSGRRLDTLATPPERLVDPQLSPSDVFPAVRPVHHGLQPLRDWLNGGIA